MGDPARPPGNQAKGGNTMPVSIAGSAIQAASPCRLGAHFTRSGGSWRPAARPQAAWDNPRMANVLSQSAALATARAIPSAVAGDHRAVARWLFACCALVFVMVVVGGVTRLTHSGLSITEWQPIMGTVPPLSMQDWQVAFDKYRATPEYLQVNKGMGLDEFKSIFWWEYAHRLLGRVIGVAFLLPFLWFLARRRIPPGYGFRLAVIFALGALQGAMGWYMVKSGLVDDPQVSQFRLTAHLGLAIVIFAEMFWVALSLTETRRVARADPAVRSARWWAHGIKGLVFLQILSGGFVAGIRAGFAYNTFPLMNGAVIPPEIMMIEPWWRNFFYNMATVQFDHRALAWLLAFTVPVLWWKATRLGASAPEARMAAHLLLAMLAVQIALGILTLIHVVPLPLAAAHQAGAVLLMAAALNLAHKLR
jgi:heme a synthase